jgi:hypothetical protein
MGWVWADVVSTNHKTTKVSRGMNFMDLNIRVKKGKIKNVRG